MKRPFIYSLLLALLALLLLVGVVSALAPPPGPSLDIRWWVMGGGEGTRSACSLRVDATIGQPAIGRSSSAPLMLSWGYWQGPTAYKTYLPLLLKRHS